MHCGRRTRHTSSDDANFLTVKLLGTSVDSSCFYAELFMNLFVLNIGQLAVRAVVLKCCGPLILFLMQWKAPVIKLFHCYFITAILLLLWTTTWISEMWSLWGRGPQTENWVKGSRSNHLNSQRSHSGVASGVNWMSFSNSMARSFQGKNETPTTSKLKAFRR